MDSFCIVQALVVPINGDQVIRVVGDGVVGASAKKLLASTYLRAFKLPVGALCRFFLKLRKLVCNYLFRILVVVVALVTDFGSWDFCSMGAASLIKISV